MARRRRHGVSPLFFPAQPVGRSVGRSDQPFPFVVANQTYLPRRSTPAPDAGALVLAQCPQVEGLRVQAPDTACLDPAEGWERPNRARVDDIVKQWAPLGAGKVHVDALLDSFGC